MIGIFDLLAKSNSPSLMILIIGIILVIFSKEYFQAVIRLKKIRQNNFEETSGNNPVAESPPQSVVDFNFKLLEKYYEQHLVEYKLMARASLIIAILGFLVIVFGVFFTFANQVSIGVITSVAGLVSEAAAVLFFKQNNLLIDQVKEYHKKLVSTQYLLTSISIASELPDQAAVFQRERIIGNLLFLSNELHGARSDHLFSEIPAIE